MKFLIFLSIPVISLSDNLIWPPEIIDRNEILTNGNELSDEDAEKKYFSERTLVYITPWNNKGYDLARRTAKKLDLIAPVWFQVKPSQESQLNCNITGEHDIDHSWIDSLRAENTKTKILPRVIFENWSRNLLEELLSDTIAQKRCAINLANVFARNQFDGIVLDGYMPLLATVGKLQAKPLIIEFFDTISSRFRKMQMFSIYALPPLQKMSQVLTSSDVLTMTKSANFVQIMTYDYQGNQFDGVAPYPWVENILFELKSNGINMRKVMIGLNWYGYENKQNPIDSRGPVAELAKTREELQWDDRSLEHYVKIGRKTIYYPTMTSLELRINLAAAYGAGIGIWDYGQGFDSFCRLF